MPTSKDTREFMEKLAPLPNYAHSLVALHTAAIPPSPQLLAAIEPRQDEDVQSTSEDGALEKQKDKVVDTGDSDEEEEQEGLATRPARPLSRTCSSHVTNRLVCVSAVAE
jgi:hypothetical protein